VGGGAACGHEQVVLTTGASAGGAVAAIDCGTNSTRLLVHDGDRALDRLTTITRLGSGVDATGSLDPDAVRRTLGVLEEYRTVMDRRAVERVRITATSAARDAANRDDFFEPAAAIVGAAPELLSGVDEAALAFRGATSELDPVDGPFAVVDIGGGSTEFAVGSDELIGAMSLDIGCVRLTEKYIESDPPLPEELLACLSVTEVHLDDVTRELPGILDARQLVGLAGTVTTAAAVEIGLATYDRDAIHHFRLTKEAAEDVYRTLATEALADRVHNPGLPEARADVIVAGMCILVRIMRYYGFDDCLVSEADILDGLVLSLL
jgi:exopolyphosphatase/guanosine-5'-triphosphate,3'-diphosphate pyrophosphatase